MSLNSHFEIVKNIFPDTEVLLMYYSGSKGYGHDDEQSDIDITVVLDGFSGNMHLQLGKIDIFAFSKDSYVKRQNFDKEIMDYYKSAVDDILVPIDKVLFLNPNFDLTYQELKNFDVNWFIANQLTALINYTNMRMKIGKVLKSHYHLLCLLLPNT